MTGTIEQDRQDSPGPATTPSEGNWWTRTCGGRDVLQLSLPLVLSTASWAIMHFVDRMFLFWYAPQSTAAALSSGMVLWTIMALPVGIAAYVNTFVAQYYGAGRIKRLGLVLFQGLAFGWATVPLFLVLIPVTKVGFSWLGHTPEMAALESTYFQVNCWGAGAAVIAAAYSSFFTGRGQTRVVMVVDIGATLLNLVLDYVWIFGKCGFPEWGIAGAAWATVVAQWAKVAVYYWLLRTPDLRRDYGLDEGRRLDPALLLRLQRFGCPNGVQMLLEGLAFTVFVVYVTRLGTLSSAATTLAISINIVAFVPMIGIGIAVSTIVGQQLGANQPRLAVQAAWSGLWLALLYNLPFAVLYVTAPGMFLAAHRLGSSTEDFAAIGGLTTVLLRFVAAYCLFDAVQLMLCSVIKGAGDTRYVLGTSVLMSGAAVALLEWGMSRQGWGLLWCWTVLMLWIVSLAVAYAFRFWQGRWTELRVIESETA